MQAACALLFRHWADGTQLEALPPKLVPADRAEAYRVQALLESYSRAPLFGWKIAATSVAGAVGKLNVKVSLVNEMFSLGIPAPAKRSSTSFSIPHFIGLMKPSGGGGV